MSAPICELPKNSREKIQFRLNEFKGKHYLDMRVYTKPENEGGQDIPTKKGLTVAVELYPQFRAALAEVEKAIITRGLIDREDLDL